MKITINGRNGEQVFDNAHVYIRESVYFESLGITPNTRVTVRIPAKKSLGVYIGDELTINGVTYTVIGVNNNFDCKTKLSHCKIAAKK